MKTLSSDITFVLSLDISYGFIHLNSKEAMEKLLSMKAISVDSTSASLVDEKKPVEENKSDSNNNNASNNNNVKEEPKKIV